MTPFSLKISSPEGDLFSGKVLSLSLRGTEGDLAVMAGHIPFISYVKECDCRILLENEKEIVSHTPGGILTVGKDETVFLCSAFTPKEE